MFEVVNCQRKIRIEITVFELFARQIAEIVSETKSKTYTVAFVSDRRMRELNKTFRGKNSTTDVLSFPYQTDEFEIETENLGDIVISLEQAQKQSAENNLTLETEIKQLILHGVLHLCGYDHETDAGEMNAAELRLRDKLSIN